MFFVFHSVFIFVLGMLQAPRRHVQVTSWDCGLACACSAIVHFGDTNVTAGNLALQFKNSHPSSDVWTVDIVTLLLIVYNLDVKFFTTSIHANDSLATLPFYVDTWDLDRDRVQGLYCDPRVTAVTQVKHLDVADIITMLRASNLIIALVDKRVLQCVVEHEEHYVSNVFAGHYVLLYDFHDGYFLYLDPDRNACDSCRMTILTFDAARLANGTDEDVIAISRK